MFPKRSSTICALACMVSSAPIATLGMSLVCTKVWHVVKHANKSQVVLRGPGTMVISIAICMPRAPRFRILSTTQDSSRRQRLHRQGLRRQGLHRQGLHQVVQRPSLFFTGMPTGSALLEATSAAAWLQFRLSASWCRSLGPKLLLELKSTVHLAHYRVGPLRASLKMLCPSVSLQGGQCSREVVAKLSQVQVRGVWP